MHPIVTWKWSLVLARCYRCWRTWIQGFILPFYLLYLSSTNIVYWMYSSLCAVYMYSLTCIYVSSRYLCVISVTYRKCFASNYCASISVNVYVYMLVHWRMARFLSLYCSASRYCLCSIPVTIYILCMSCIEFSIQLCHCLCSALKRSSKSIPVTYLSALRCCFFFFFHVVLL